MIQWCRHNGIKVRIWQIVMIGKCIDNERATFTFIKEHKLGMQLQAGLPCYAPFSSFNSSLSVLFSLLMSTLKALPWSIEVNKMQAISLFDMSIEIFSC